MTEVGKLGLRDLTLFISIMLIGFQPINAQVPGPKPNIVFIMADDLGWGDLSCYGQDRYQTPNLDALAAEGKLFTNFYTSSPVCSPSRAGILTGQFPERNRIFGHFADEKRNQARGMPNFLDPQVPSLARILQQHGYATGHFGKWHLGDGVDAPLPTEYGIDEHLTFASADPRSKTDFNLDDPALRSVNTKMVLDEGIKFIEAHQDQPFFVNLWLYDVHATLNPSEGQLSSHQKFSSNKVSFHAPATIYYATVHEMDKQVGLFLDKLKTLGLEDNTIVIFTSDNGPEDIFVRNAAHSGVGSAGPFRGRKRSLYEGGIRVPFIIRWPAQVPANRVDERTVLTGVDLLPTLCQLAGLKMPTHLSLDGEDLSQAMISAPKQRQKPIFWQSNYRVQNHIWNRSPRLAIRDGDWKFLMNPDGSRQELYAMGSDPYEGNNLAAARPEHAVRLSKQLLQWFQQMPESIPHPAAGKNDYPWPRDSLMEHFPDRLKYLGVALEEANYFTWGASPVIDQHGKVHLFVARWPKETQMGGWKTHSEIARYVSDSPEGPFTFEEVVLQGTPEKLAPHNPNIRNVKDTYVLTYICNQQALSKNQKIYMMVSDRVTGPWRHVNSDGLVLDLPRNDSIWSYKSRVGVNNPSLLMNPQGKFYLYYKAIPTNGGLRQFGVAISDLLEGPYQHHHLPVAAADGTIEDAYAFMYADDYFLLSRKKKDGVMPGIDGILWKSQDGLRFGQPTIGYHDVSHYYPNGTEQINWIARQGQFERPQLLLVEGIPKYLYCAGAFNTEGRDVACTYMFRID